MYKLGWGLGTCSVWERVSSEDTEISPSGEQPAPSTVDLPRALIAIASSLGLPTSRPSPLAVRSPGDEATHDRLKMASQLAGCR